ncbi:MAG TPA: hypothetical protein VFQ47_01430 [Nitrososphaera sp.]|jgi:hypothetical protein|nr:hypothetical protein [Nitrososphaera sp.]
MDLVQSFAVHFLAVLLLCFGILGLINAIFGNVALDYRDSFFSIVSETGNRKIDALIGLFCLFLGLVILLVAVRGFLPSSYFLLLAGFFLIATYFIVMFKYLTRSVEAFESTFGKYMIFAANGLLIVLVLVALFSLGEYLWRRVEMVA